MKQKKINKKLSINKETVSNLASDAMAGIKGGAYTVLWTCGWDCNTDLTCGRETLCDDCWTNNPIIC